MDCWNSGSWNRLVCYNLNKVSYGLGLETMKSTPPKEVSKMQEMHSISFRFCFSFSGGAGEKVSLLPGLRLRERARVWIRASCSFELGSLGGARLY